jgi:nitroimidazol reductase NimA-like FMN-containing flavoprotein (pyridoxamine 5'-phosphate oxidase superfamily)
MGRWQMRKKNREITNRKEIDEIIRDSQVCRLALSVGDVPYLVPLSFGYDGDAIYIHTALEGKKIEYFKHNNRVCFEFERNLKLIQNAEKACKWTFWYECVIGYGTISELIELEEKKHGLNQIMEHYSGKQWEFDEGPLEKARVWKIFISSMTGKRLKKGVEGSRSQGVEGDD